VIDNLVKRVSPTPCHFRDSLHPIRQKPEHEVVSYFFLGCLTIIQTNEKAKEVYQKARCSRAIVFWWHKQFLERKTTEALPICG